MTGRGDDKVLALKLPGLGFLSSQFFHPGLSFLFGRGIAVFRAGPRNARVLLSRRPAGIFGQGSSHLLLGRVHGCPAQGRPQGQGQSQQHCRYLHESLHSRSSSPGDFFVIPNSSLGPEWPEFIRYFLRLPSERFPRTRLCKILTINDLFSAPDCERFGVYPDSSRQNS